MCAETADGLPLLCTLNHFSVICLFHIFISIFFALAKQLTTELELEFIKQLLPVY